MANQIDHAAEINDLIADIEDVRRRVREIRQTMENPSSARLLQNAVIDMGGIITSLRIAVANS